MKKMVLTGLATEQSFTSPKPTCFLVFNNGELKVPVSEEAAEIVVQEMYGGSPIQEAEPEEPESSNGHYVDEDYGDSDMDEETGVGQI